MRLRLCVLAAVVAIVATGCGLPYLAPPGAAPLRYRDLVFPASSVTTTKDIVYGNAPDSQGNPVSLALDLYRPTGDTDTHRPAIVWVHGGSFCCGDRTSPELVIESNYFAREGYVNASIDYRLDPAGCSAAGGATPACIAEILNAQHDAQAAVRFLRANAATYGIDPNRIAIGGTSAGAITALNVGANSGDVGTSGNPGFSSAVEAAVSLSGAKLFGVEEKTDAPILMFHGTADPLVPYQWALNTYNEAQAAGLTSYLTTWPGEGHAPYAQHQQEILDQTTNFLYWALDLTHAATS